MTLSLLKNKNEFDNLRIRAHTYTRHENPDLDWIRVEHSKYSQRFTDHNSEFDEMIVKTNGIIFSNSKSKSKLLKAVKLVDALFYFDFNFNNVSKTEKELRQFFEKLENSVIKSQPTEGFALGMRFNQSMDEIMADMTERQSKDLKSAINDYLFAQKYVHYELGLNGKFIPIDDYFEVRKKEGGYVIFTLLVEYVHEISLSEQIYAKLEIKQFLEQLNRYYLALSDCYDFKSKLAKNDISSHIISYAADNHCSLQEAVDMNDVVFGNSKLKAIELQNSIMRNDLLNSSEVELFMNTLLAFNESFHQFYAECIGFENKDGLVFHKKWENEFLFKLRPIHSKFEDFMGRNNVFSLKLREQCMKEYLYFSCINEQIFQKYDSICLFAPIWHPNCNDVYRMEMQIKICLIFWILDDHTECEWGDGGRDFGRTEILWSQVLECLDKLDGKTVIGQHWRPYIWAFFGVSEVILNSLNYDQKKRYINSWRAYAHGCINEAKYYNEKKWQNLDEMFKIREDSSGCIPAFSMIEYMNDITLTENQWCDQNLQQMITFACKWVVIINDYFGFESELKECGHDVTKMRNTIALLVLIEKIEFQSAVYKAIDLAYEAETKYFECQAKFLSSQTGDQINTARKYITCFNHWMAGTWVVQNCAERYKHSGLYSDEEILISQKDLFNYLNYN